MRATAILLAALVLANTTFAAFGDLDTTFGTNGSVTFHAVRSGSGLRAEVSRVLRQSDGKFIVVGFVVDDNTTGSPTTLTIKRYLENGTLDTTYGSSGTAVPYNMYGSPSSAALDSNGKLLVGGRYGIFSGFPAANHVWRFNTNGWYDPGFGTNGRASVGSSSYSVGDVDSIKLSANSTTPYVLYEVDGVIKRLNHNGTPDNTFGTSGSLPGNGNRFVKRDATTFENASIVSARISLEDTYLALRGFNGNGQVDSNFGNGGLVLAYVGGSFWIRDLIRTPQGKFLVNGFRTTPNSNMMESFISSHTSDGFMENSILLPVVINQINRLAANSDGTIVFTYGDLNPGTNLKKLTPNLVVSDEEPITSYCRDILVLPNTRLLCGTSSNSIKRYLQ